MAGSEWRVLANLWDGDRALGGRLSVDGGRLRFRPHAVDRATGGDTSVDIALADVAGLTSSPRSLRSPRRRLVVLTRDGQQLYFLVNRIDRVTARLRDDVVAAGGSGHAVVEGSVDLVLPEDSPNDTAVMRLIYSPWVHGASVVFWLVCLIGVLGSSGNPYGVAALLAVVVISGWGTVHSLRRRRLLRGGR